MPSFPECMREYKKQLDQGDIQVAYKGLMEYLLALRTHFQNKYPDFVVSGSIYFGYMDMTYFSIIPRSLKERNLKIALVFVHQAFRFEVWLAGFNKQVQTRYWKLLKASGWDKYHLVPTPQGFDSILEHVLVEKPDFHDLSALTAQIELNTMQFIADVETFLSTHAGDCQ